MKSLAVLMDIFPDFGNVLTNTCIAIGPNWSEEIDKITGGLKLL